MYSEYKIKPKTSRCKSIEALPTSLPPLSQKVAEQNAETVSHKP